MAKKLSKQEADKLLANKLKAGMNKKDARNAGTILAILGYLSNSNNSLQKIAEEAALNFFVPKTQEGNLSYSTFGEDMNKLGEFRAYDLLRPAYRTWSTVQGIHSDNYLAQEFSRTPELSAIHDGLQKAQQKARELDEEHILVNESKTADILTKRSVERAISSIVKSEAEEKYKHLTKEELDAWEAQWESYFREDHRQNYLANAVLYSEEVSTAERDEWRNRYGEDWENLWMDHWVSLKKDREAYEHWQSGELTEAEWDQIKKHFADDWEEKKENYRERYLQEVWIPNWEAEHEEIWHPAPEWTRDLELDEADNWCSFWAKEEDGLKPQWIKTYEMQMCKMGAFFGLGDSLDTGMGENYQKEQEFLRQIEAKTEQEKTASMDEAQRNQYLADEKRKDDLAYYDNIYNLFTEQDFSFLDTKEYLKLKKAMIEAVTNMAKAQQGNAVKWKPNSPANDALCALMPIFDSIGESLDEYNDWNPLNMPEDYSKIMKTAVSIRDSLKFGATTYQMGNQLERLLTCAAHCERYMQEHPKGFFLFHWRSNSRYNVINKLYKKIREQLPAIKKSFEDKGKQTSIAALDAEAKLNEAKKAVKNAQHANLAKKHSQIQEDFAKLKELQNGRKSVAGSAPQIHSQPEAAKKAPQNGRSSVPNH